MGRWRVAVALALGTVLLSACGDAGEGAAQRDLSSSIGRGPDPASPSHGTLDLDVEHQRWELDVEPDTGEYRLSASITLLATRDVDVVVLDHSGPAPDAVTVAGDEVAYTSRAGKLLIEHGARAGERLDLTVRASGRPQPTETDGLRGSFGWIVGDGSVNTLAIVPGHLSSWVPLNDTPLDPAITELVVTVPPTHVARATGLRGGVTAEGDQVSYRFDSSIPVTEVHVVVAPLEVIELGTVEGVVVHAAVAPGSDLPRSFDALPRMLRFLTDLLGPPPVRELGLTVLPELRAGGDSTLGHITLGQTEDVVLVHELAHQWMGGARSTATLADSWMQEGLPTYVELLWAEAEGRGSLDGTVLRRREQLGPTTRPLVAVASPADRADEVTFQRGALAFHALHVDLGDEAFGTVMRELCVEGRGEPLTTEDLEELVQAVTGRDPSGVLDPWLEDEQLPPSPGS